MKHLFFPSTGVSFPLNSISVDGSNEYFMKGNAGGDPTIGIADEWSISMWIRPHADMLTSTNTPLELKAVATSSNKSRLYFSIFGTVANDPLRIYLYTSAGSNFKLYSYNSLFTVNVWTHLLATWNGTTGDVLTLHVDGSETAVTTPILDGAGAMDNIARRITYGANTSGTADFEGHIAHLAMWDSVLTAAEATEIANSNLEIDLTADTGDYTSSANLIHYWRVGADSADIGKDEGTAGDIDLMDDQSGIDATNIDESIYPGA